MLCFGQVLDMNFFEQRYHATVTVLHALTKNPETIAREADIVIAAVGMPNLVRGSWLKPGAVVIDVGTYPIEVYYTLHSVSSSCLLNVFTSM